MPVSPARLPSAGPSAPERGSPQTDSRNGSSWLKGRVLTVAFPTVDDGDDWLPMTAAFESAPDPDAGTLSVLAKAAMTPAAPRLMTITAMADQRLRRRRDSRRPRRDGRTSSEA